MSGGAADRLRRLEDRLERLLAVGWRNAEADRAALRAEIPRLEALGLSELAGQVRAAVETDGESFLAATTRALHFARLLRARLVEPAVPPGNWEPFVAQRRASRAVDRLVPIGRVPFGEGEVWACARLRGFAVEWILVEPPRDEVGAPWLTGVAVGQLRWRGRYPVGASGEVTLTALDDLHWLPRSEEGEHPLAAFQKSLSTRKLGDGMSLIGFNKSLQVLRLAPEDAAGCAWPDPRMAQAFVAVAREPVWVIAASDGKAVTPLVVVEPPGFFGGPSLVHLVEGNPREPIRFDE